MRKKPKTLYANNLIWECSLDLSSEVGSAEKKVELKLNAEDIVLPHQNQKPDNQNQSPSQ